MPQVSRVVLALVLCGLVASVGAAPAAGALKKEALAGVVERTKLAQRISDSLFSFSELGFQEVETARYITTLLEKNGFEVRQNVAGIPTAWMARWSNGSGGPTLALGSDIDCIPKASQKPGIPWHEPLIEGAPGHGEGHNSGQAVNIVAALSLQALMRKHGIAGTLVLWPGVAEELLGGKAYLVRAGAFTNVDVVIFTHVSDNLSTAWGQPRGTGLVSVEYTFSGESAHSANAPWRGRSALDAVELMNMAWDKRREHLRPEQRSHYVITDGGDQPNVVPSRASVWYYFREQTFDAIGRNYALGSKLADAAATMTDTTVTHRLLGTAAPQHFNRPLAEAAFTNMRAIGLPQWSSDEQAFARTVQHNLGAEERGLATELDPLAAPAEKIESGGSDDIGDVSWTVPTITIRYPSNIPDLPGHHWANAIAMATPIAHKGVVTGAKAVATTSIDVLVDAKLRAKIRDYFVNVQTKNQQYVPMLTADDKAPIELNSDVMARYRNELKQYYYDEAKYETYLEQLGITFPTLEKPTSQPAR